MKAVTYQGVRKLEYTTVPDPAILKPGDAIIRIEIAGICGSDLHVYNGRELGIDPGTIMGHEFMGEVIEVGTGVRNYAPGQLVISPFFSSCGNCFYCQHELSCRCDRGELFGWIENGMGLHGTQAQYVRVPMADTTLYPLKDGIDTVHGLMLGDILPTAFYCVDMANPIPGGSYAVIGCGPVGLLIVQALRSKGIDRIFALDPVKERLKLAEGLGAIVMDPSNESQIQSIIDATEGRGVEAVLEAAGNPSSQKLAYHLVRKGGIISVVGVHNEPEFSFAPVDLYDKNLTYRTGRCPVQQYLPEIESMIQQGADFSKIITHRLNLQQVTDAYEQFNRRDPGVLKMIIQP